MRITMENEKLNHALKSKTESMKGMTDTINSLTIENNMIHSKFESASHENKQLYESLTQRAEQVEQLKSDLESVKIVSILLYKPMT
jgi:hypothetical protein